MMSREVQAAVHDVLVRRLVNQELARPRLREAEALVSRFGAIQAQDFQGAKWAIGVRTDGLTDEAVERAFNDGRLLRTHVLRPTWHFVAAADIRWLVALTGPRVFARMAYRRRQLGLDDQEISRSRRAIVRALRDGPLTRRQIATALERAHLLITPERLTHLVMAAELEGLVCSGPLLERRFTYALMDTRAPEQAPLSRDEALGRLAERYFASHGPATAADFAWWSGLSLRDARAASEIAGTRRNPETPRAPKRAAWLLPNFDEYLVAYRDRSAIHGGHAAGPPDALANTVIVGGSAVGTWRPRRGKDTVAVEVRMRRSLSRDDWNRVADAAGRYGRFIGRPVEMTRVASA